MILRQTMSELRERVSRGRGDRWSGTLGTAADASDVVIDAGIVQAANFFSNAYFKLSLDGDMEEHRITSNLAAGAITLVGDGLTQAHAQGTAWEIHFLRSASDYNGLIGDAIIDAEPVMISNLDYQGITIEQDVFEYDLPNNFRYINEIWMQNNDGAFDIPVHFDDVRIIPGTIHQLALWENRGWLVGQKLRLLGQGPQTIPNAFDSGVVSIDAAYMTAHVRHALEIMVSSGTGVAAQEALRRLRGLEATLELRRDEMTRSSRAMPGSLVVQ